MFQIISKANFIAKKIYSFIFMFYSMMCINYKKARMILLSDKIVSEIFESKLYNVWKVSLPNLQNDLFYFPTDKNTCIFSH